MSRNLYPSRELSERELKISGWLVKHWLSIKNALKIFFILFDAILIVGSIVAWGVYANNTKLHNTALESLNTSLINWSEIRTFVQAKPLVINEVDKVASSGSKTDFIAHITNLNSKHWVSDFRYRFLWSSGSTPWQNSFILPNQSKYVFALAVDTASASGVRLELSGISWKRIPRIGGTNLLQERDKLMITSSEFIPNFIGGQPESPVSAVFFEVENQGPFRYREVGFQVILKSGFSYQAVNYTTLLDIEPHSKRSGEVRWFYALPQQVQDIIIEPEINFFDESQILLSSEASVRLRRTESSDGNKIPLELCSRGGKRRV